jgi:SAM-dependent methyltransferase
MSAMKRSWLAHPLTRGLDLDDPGTTALRRRIIRQKRFLKKIYEEWYRELAASLPKGEGAIVELGAGAGFLAERIPELTTSDLQLVPGIDLVADAHRLPFGEGSLRAIVLTNLLHHLQSPRSFLAEAARTLRPGGVLSMIEPWVSPWSRFIYRRLHHEPFDPGAEGWGAPAGGPLSSANGALPWIIFSRDFDLFRRETHGLKVERLRPMMPFKYLLSGGVSMRALMPGWSFGGWTLIELLLRPAMPALAMFAHIVLRRS